MANNYTLWSEFFQLNSREEYDWMKKVLCLDTSEVVFDSENYDENISDNEIIFNYLSKEFGVELASTYEADYFPGFSVEFSDDESSVSLYTDDSGNIENCVSVIQAFLKKFRPDSFFSIQWADTCSRPRVGEFGGGAAFITANNVEYFSTSSWVNNMYNKFVHGNSNK